MNSGQLTIEPRTKSDVDVIRVTGARTHNLKNLSLDIPANAVVVVTGPSGSGKSSLAIDTIFAEGQRQYIESLSLYARQFFNQTSEVEVDEIEGLRPTVCINQNRGSANPRSTVGTLTEIYDYLRLLYARAGQLHCHLCGQAMSPQTLQEICDAICRLGERTKVMILAPMVSGRKGQHVEVFERIRKERLVRVRINGELCDIENLPELSSGNRHDIDAVADRIIIKEGIGGRLYESVQLAVRLGEGAIAISYLPPGSDEWVEQHFNTTSSCPACGVSHPRIEPRSFSFNSPHGACLKCDGLGYVESFDLARTIPDRKLSVDEGAVVIWNYLSGKERKKRGRWLLPILEELGCCLTTPLTQLSEQEWESFVHGDRKTAPGLLALLEKEWVTAMDEDWRDELEQFRARIVCNECRGTRLNRYADSIQVGGRSISQLCALPISQTKPFFDSLSFDETLRPITGPIIEEVQHRLEYLIKTGVDYLTLDRPSDSLSGGELQRVRLASAIGSGLTGALYVLDEPSIGLHPGDVSRLTGALFDLKEKGNSLIIVEHDESMIRAADHVIDMGPGAGRNGGDVVAEGSIADIENVASSPTGAWLSGRRTMQRPVRQMKLDHPAIRIYGASGYNLKAIDVVLPTGALNCVTGVSGSGKSTLVYRTLAPAIKQKLGRMTVPAEPFDRIEGLEDVHRLVEVDQRPISRTPRGCPATYTGIMDDIRRIFAGTKLARQKGYSATRFSFNSKTGWCPDCEGYGSNRISMKFMPDMDITCPTCEGKRFNRSTLQVTFRDLSIADVLGLSVADALIEFEAFSGLHQKLKCLNDVGLGYLQLGQPSTTLSGGEAQRIKLATELSVKQSGDALYLLDEPTTGLHFDDIQRLLNVLNSLVEMGNTVIVIEHNLDIIRCADWIVDLGPGAGNDGGQVVVAGTVQQVQRCPSSLTGQCLQPHVQCSN